MVIFLSSQETPSDHPALTGVLVSTTWGLCSGAGGAAGRRAGSAPEVFV